MRFLKKALGDEKGASIVFVAIFLVVIFGFAVLAIDGSLMQLAKTQLQNAADASSIAGASALALSTGDEATAVAEAKAEAIRMAGLNVAVQDTQSPVIINEGDVIVEYDSGEVTAITHRTKATGDPVRLYFMKVLGPENKGEMTATATARVMPISGTSCLRPFCPPDRWDDADSNGLYDPGEFYDPDITGYTSPRDIGSRVTLKMRQANQDLQAEWYYIVRFPPINSGEPWNPGAADYVMWIVGDSCEPYIVSPGDQFAFEPGAKVGPTNHALADLIAKDPTARWDETNGTVINSAYPRSPRIIIAAAFDPTIGVQSAPPRYVTVSKLMALFLEEHDGTDVIGRFMRILTEGEPCPGCPQGFLSTVALVK